MRRRIGFGWNRFLNWDHPSQIGFLLAILLLIPALIVIAAGTEETRPPAIIGAIGLVIIAQVIFMWANRGMVAEYTQAQRHYLKGDFAAACAVLEELRRHHKADLRALSLLGNTYRQLGQLPESEAVLRKAVTLDERQPFALYGLGRTLLVSGRYAEAAATLEQALINGAAEVCRFDAGEVYYRLGETQKAIELLQSARIHLLREPHRLLMTVYWLHKLADGEPPSAKLIGLGLPYWQAQAKLFAQTPYGAELTQDITTIQSMTASTSVANGNPFSAPG